MTGICCTSPIGNKCLCESDSCKFQDATKPIGPNGVDVRHCLVYTALFSI